MNIMTPKNIMEQMTKEQLILALIGAEHRINELEDEISRIINIFKILKDHGKLG